MNKEIIREIKGFEGRYGISNLGDIYSYVGKRMKKLKGNITPRGYKQVTLRKDGKNHVFYVHRLVVEAFIGEIPNGLQVNHRNEIKTDNFILLDD